MPFSGATENEGVFSPWKGQRPNRLLPRRVSATYCPTTSSMGFRALSSSRNAGEKPRLCLLSATHLPAGRNEQLVILVHGIFVRHARDIIAHDARKPLERELRLEILRQHLGMGDVIGIKLLQDPSRLGLLALGDRIL